MDMKITKENLNLGCQFTWCSDTLLSNESSSMPVLGKNILHVLCNMCKKIMTFRGYANANIILILIF